MNITLDIVRDIMISEFIAAVECITAVESTVRIGNNVKEAICRNGSDRPPLRFEYTYQEPFMFLRIENISNVTVSNIRIKRDFRDAVKPYFDNESTDRFRGISFDLYPGDSKRDVVGHFPLCFDYPRPYSMITINVSYKYGRKEMNFKREVHLTS